MLGLSLAEIFLILLFLLLVVFMGVTSGMLESNEKMHSELTAIQELLRERGRPIPEADFDELVAAVDELMTASDEAIEDRDKIIDELRPRADELRSKNLELAEKIDILGVKKGQLPPCWYEKIPGDQKKTEKEIKSFDIQFFDRSVVVVKRETPVPSDRIQLGNLANVPIINDQFLGEAIPYETFIDVFKPYLDAGENKRVQSYRCRFHVGVWDATSNKATYKHRLQMIEFIFFKYLYQGDPWPYQYNDAIY